MYQPFPLQRLVPLQPPIIARIKKRQRKLFFLSIVGAAYEEAVISLQGSSIRFIWKDIGYLRYPLRVLLAS